MCVGGTPTSALPGAASNRTGLGFSPARLPAPTPAPQMPGAAPGSSLCFGPAGCRVRFHWPLTENAPCQSRCHCPPDWLAINRRLPTAPWVCFICWNGSQHSGNMLLTRSLFTVNDTTQAQLDARGDRAGTRRSETKRLFVDEGNVSKSYVWPEPRIQII